ncbi:MAG: RNA methyltransferase [Candidatus Lokiarchaeota archaeon]|nr:RNA methyltransferase [Candidatus Lokiarchaeota archaeon]
MKVSLENFDLIITCPRFRERDASAEATYFLAEIGDEEVKVEPIGIPGLLYSKTKLGAFNVIEKLKDYIEDNLVFFEYTLRYIPIEIVVNSTIDNIVEVVDKLKDKIDEEETFRITIEKRHTHIDRNELIDEAAKCVKREVDLDNPDKIILIEIVGDKTGISIIEEGDIISIPILKREEEDIEEEDILPY